MKITIRDAAVTDGAVLSSIYNYYVDNTCSTFETAAVGANDMAQRIFRVQNARDPWLVAEAEGQTVGFAHASKWKGRCAYRFSVESTVYVRCGYDRQGIGLQLYSALVDAVRTVSMHSMIGGIALPNEASVRLHERLGFNKVAHFEQVGYKLERWVDVGYWQLML